MALPVGGNTLDSGLAGRGRFASARRATFQGAMSGSSPTPLPGGVLMVGLRT